MSELSRTVPDLRARMLDELVRTIEAMADALAKRTGRTADDLSVQTYVGAVFGVMLSAMTPDYLAGNEAGAEMFGRIDEALALLQAGLPL